MYKNEIKPGFHREFDISRFKENERIILKNLSTFCYLTNSGSEINIGKSSYSYFLLKPNDKFAEMFNINREIICLFSTYQNFEPRTLETYNKIIDEVAKFRVENICFILISKDNNIDEKINNLIETEPEHPIVIPFSYLDLTKQILESAFENKFREKFYTRDLFSFSSALKKDTYFFGRNNLVNGIVNKHKSFEHSGLFGLRKSGKTSIIYAVQRRFEIENISYLFTDCESPNVHLKRWYQLLEKIVRDYHNLNSINLKINYEGRYLEHNAADNFEIDIIKIFNARGKKYSVFIFDEIERITPGISSSEHWKSENDFLLFWQTLRAFIQKNTNVFTYMLVGTNPTCIEKITLNSSDNPLYGSIQIEYVPSFSVEQVKEMVQKLSFLMGVEIDDHICIKLFDDFGGHPFLIRQMCSLMNKRISAIRPVKIDKTLYNSTIEQFEASLLKYTEMMTDVIKEWYPEEFEMLIYLANNDKDVFNNFASNNLNLTQHLIGYGLIKKGSDGFCFNFEIVEKHVRKINKFKKINLTLEEKIAEISSRRNKIEKELRVLLRNSLRSSVGQKEALKRVLAIIETDRRIKFEGQNLNVILDKDNSKLYLLDLIQIINKNWHELSNTFEIEKNKLIYMLNEINGIGRPDAHARGISEDEFTQVRLYLKKIEAILQELSY